MVTESERAYYKKYRLKNLDKLKAYRKQYYQKTKEQALECSTRWNKEHADIIRNRARVFYKLNVKTKTTLVDIIINYSQLYKNISANLYTSYSHFSLSIKKYLFFYSKRNLLPISFSYTEFSIPTNTPPTIFYNFFVNKEVGIIGQWTNHVRKSALKNFGRKYSL